MLLGMAAVSAFAQKTPSLEKIDQATSLSSTEWEKTIADSKQEIADLTQENARLTSEYDMLKEKLTSLQSEVLELKEQAADKERGNQGLKQFRLDQSKLQEKIKADMEKIQREIGEIESEKIALLTQLKEEEKKTEGWQSQLSELQVKKRELTLELKLQEISKQELEQGEDEELEKLKADLAKYQEEEKALDQQIQSLRSETTKVPPQVDKIVLANKEFQVKIDRLKVEQEQQKRLNDDLTAQNAKLEAQAQNLPADLIQEKASLDGEIKKLEDQLAQVKASIEGSKEFIQKKRQLMDEIMRMDQENQDMRRKIEELMTKEGESQPQVSE